MDHVASSSPSRSLVAHVVVVGFHAQLGNRIEFAYPRLRGETVLRSPRLADTSDILDNPNSPAVDPLSPRPNWSLPTTPLQDISTGFTPPPPLSTSSNDQLRGAAANTPLGNAPHHPSPPTNLSTPTPTRGKPPHFNPPASSQHEDLASRDSAEWLRSESPVLWTSNNTTKSPKRRALATKGDWGSLPAEWLHLPFMALPDGAHDLEHDVVFFALPPDVHCVSCFRQADAIDAITHSASRSVRKEDSSVAARGSVQKSVVLLCRRPLYGFLANRLVTAVRAYFDQGDFARTETLTALFHSLNDELAKPTRTLSSALFHGISLRSLLTNLGPQTLAVLKLILLEKRVVLYSHPVYKASSAVVAIASILPGSLDTLAPDMTPVDVSADDIAYAMPLALFGPQDRVLFQPYAPLPVVSDLLSSRGPFVGCLLGTSHNVGMLLASNAASAARRAPRSSSVRNLRASSASSPSIGMANQATKTSHTGMSIAESAVKKSSIDSGQPRVPSNVQGNAPPVDGTVGTDRFAQRVDDGGLSNVDNHCHSADELDMPSEFTIRRRPQYSSPSAYHGGLYDTATSNSSGLSSTTAAESSAAQITGRAGGRLPLVDALVNLSTGKVSVAGSIEPLCRITRQERRFMRDLITAASLPLEEMKITESSSSKKYRYQAGSDQYIRARFREYLQGLLGSVSSVRGVRGGPRGADTWSPDDVSSFSLTGVGEYNERFVHAWLQTRNAAQWSRKCSSVAAVARGVPLPELEESVIDDPLLPVAVDKVAAGLSGFREFVSTKAVEGISSFFSRLEVELGRIETAISKSIVAAPSPFDEEVVKSEEFMDTNGNGTMDHRGSRRLRDSPYASLPEISSIPGLRHSRSGASVFPPEAIPAEDVTTKVTEDTVLATKDASSEIPVGTLMTDQNESPRDRL